MGARFLRIAKLFGLVAMSGCLSGCATMSPDWPVRHADTANSDRSSSMRATSPLEKAWSFAPNAPVGTFAAIGDGATLYTHTYGTPMAANSAHAGCHLWAIDAKSGNVRWCSDEVGPALTSLTIDAGENVYVADTRQLFRFSPDGERVWSVAVPSETSGISWLGGNLLIADYAGNLAVRDPRDGRLLSSPFQMPAAPYADGPITAAFAKGQMLGGVGAEYLPRLIRNFFGYGVRIKDMPAVEQTSGAIFITANGTTAEEGLLYKINWSSGDATFSMGCTAELDPAIDASPVLSRDGRRVYTVSGGLLRAHRTADCAPIWQIAQAGSSYASPALSADGTIYLMAGGKLAAIKDVGTEARLLWTLEADDAARLEQFDHGVFDSVPVLSGSHIYVAGSFGLDEGDYTFPLAHRLFVIDARSGELLQSLELGEESDSTPSVSRDGWVYVPTKALSLGHAHSLQRAGLLREELEKMLRPAIANGIYAFRPKSD